MLRSEPFELTHDTPVYVISVAAQLAGLHPQTLRQYDRMGLVSPGRAPGQGRRYSTRDIETLREVHRLSQAEGVNLAGIKQILRLEALVGELRQQVAELQQELADTRAAAAQQVADVHASYRRELEPTPETSLVVWHPPTRRR